MKTQSLDRRGFLAASASVACSVALPPAPAKKYRVTTAIEFGTPPSDLTRGLAGAYRVENGRIVDTFTCGRVLSMQEIMMMASPLKYGRTMKTKGADA